MIIALFLAMGVEMNEDKFNDYWNKIYGKPFEGED